MKFEDLLLAIMILGMIVLLVCLILTNAEKAYNRDIKDKAKKDFKDSIDHRP